MSAIFRKVYMIFNSTQLLTALKSSYYDIQEKFGSNLKRIRESNGLSLRDLSSKCNLDDSKISKIENGRFNIQLSTIIELAKGLELEPKELLNFKI